MLSRYLYYMTDRTSPRVTLSDIALHFPVVTVTPAHSNFDWFNWDASGCLIFDFDQLHMASLLLAQMRARWISIPTALISKGRSTQDAAELGSGFSVNFSENSDSRHVIFQLAKLIERDTFGHPSPLETRRRFGSLTCQERRVLCLSLDGLTSREIGHQLRIRSQTVDKYKRKALFKMEAKNLTVLMRQLYLALFPPWQSGAPDSEPVLCMSK